MVIYKYEINIRDLDLDDCIDVTMPGGSMVISAGCQKYGFICLWALVDLNQTGRKYTFRINGTGNQVKGAGSFKFINTVQMHQVVGGVPIQTLVWHVWEKLGE